jgi:hypothetical protein
MRLKGSLLITLFSLSSLLLLSNASADHTLKADSNEMDKNDSMNTNDFCSGMFMSMSMGGFQYSLSGKGDCLNYFVPPWKLTDKGKFYGAMIYSWLLGIMLEALTNFQIWLRPFLPQKLRKIVFPLLYGIQQWLGYIVMMVMMMYSIELFASTLLGIVVGRALFQPRSTTKAIIPMPSSELTSNNDHNEEATPLLADEQRTPLLRRRRT